MTDAELQRRTGEPHIDGWPLYSGLPPPQAVHTAAAELARPMTERDQFDMAMWHARLGELADAYYEAGRTNPARQRARADLMLHALECATGWRTRSALAAHTAAAPQAQAVRALTDPELDAVFVHTIECAQLSRDEFKAIAFAVLAAAQQGE